MNANERADYIRSLYNQIRSALIDLEELDENPTTEAQDEGRLFVGIMGESGAVSYEGFGRWETKPKGWRP